MAGHRYRVIVKDSSWGDDAKLRGNCNRDKLEIKIDESAPKSRVIEAMLHEITHAIFYEYNIHDDDKEERIVTAFSTGWQQVLSDNPDLMKLIQRAV